MSLKENRDSFHKRSFKRLANWLNPEDPAKKENERLCQEFEDQIAEYKRVKGCLDQLASDYERAKQLFVTARYRELKGMIKRTAMLVKMDQVKTGSADSTANANASPKLQHAHAHAQPSPLARDDPAPAAGASLANTGLARKSSFRRSEAQRRRDERRDKMTSEEIEAENEELRRQIARCREHLEQVKHVVAQLETRYEQSKQLLPFQRYALLKQLVKQVEANDTVRENLLAQVAQQRHQLLRTVPSNNSNG